MTYPPLCKPCLDYDWTEVCSCHGMLALYYAPNQEHIYSDTHACKHLESRRALKETTAVCTWNLKGSKQIYITHLGQALDMLLLPNA